MASTAKSPKKPRVSAGQDSVDQITSNTRRRERALLTESTTLPKDDIQSPSELGNRVRLARTEKELTLDGASQVCGVSRSTLSKVENGLMSPTFDVLQKIVRGLQIDLSALFGSPSKPKANGRRAVTRKGFGETHVAGCYRMELIATELSQKAMSPFRIRITAHSLDDFTEWGRHQGEEFLFVLSGSVCLYSELYAPTHLELGDSVYFDSRTGHAAVSTSEEDAEVLWLINEDVHDVDYESGIKLPRPHARESE